MAGQMHREHVYRNVLGSCVRLVKCTGTWGFRLVPVSAFPATLCPSHWLQPPALNRGRLP